MTPPLVTSRQLRILADLAAGALLLPAARPPGLDRRGKARVSFLLRRGRHVRGVRVTTVRRLYDLLLVQRGCITEAGRQLLERCA